MTEVTLPYRPQPRQQAFHGCEADEVLYGGAAGGGKSRALRMECAKVCLLYPGTHSLLLRRSYPELEMEIIRRWLEEIPRELGTYNDAKKRYTWRNGSITQFGYADGDRDVLRYQGAEFGWIGFDELTHFSEYQYTYLVNSRLRSTDAAAWPRVRSTTNPGGIGHAWVKARFIDAAEPGQVWRPDPARRWTRAFIPATIYDNPALLDADPTYVERLEALPEMERRALLYGDWDVFAGQVFREWRRDVHVVTPEQAKIAQHWRRFCAVDWGYADPTCCLWLACTDDGGLIVYRELHATGLRPTEIAERVLSLSAGEPIDYTVIDSQVWGASTTGEVIGETLAVAGLHTIPADKGPGSRIQGKQRVHEWLTVYDGPDGKPTSRLRVYSTCTALIRELPTLTYDAHRVEDVDDHSGGTGHADAYAALRYGLMSRPQPGQTPQAETLPTEPEARGVELERRWLAQMTERELGGTKVRRGYW